MKTFLSARPLACIILILAALNAYANGGGEAGADDTVRIVSTTGPVGDAMIELLEGMDFEGFVIMGAGVNPHGYVAAARDIEKIQDADLVLFNGLYLEAKMETLLEGLGEKAFNVGGSLPKVRLMDWDQYPDLNDPHVWFDLELWLIAVENIKNRLLPLFPGEEAAIEVNFESYTDEIKGLRQWAFDMMNTIPAENRFLITSHDAFNYFSRYYGLRTLALQGISTEDEASLQDFRDLTDLIVENKVPSIFTESSVSPKNIEALQEAVEARGWNVAVPEAELISDALGATSPEDTFVGMFRHNIEVITEYLGGEGV